MALDRSAALPLLGGCHCGQVRYRATKAPVRTEICHCTDCRKATGGLFAALVDFERAAVTIAGEVGIHASSPKVKRGFCPACGTPLFYDHQDETVICMTLGSLDAPDLVRPDGHCGTQSKLSWYVISDGLPQRKTGEPFEG